MNNVFSKKEALRFGWQTVRNRFWPIVGIFVFASAIYVLPSLLADFAEEREPVLSFVLGVASFIFATFIQLGLTKVSLKLYDGEAVKARDVFSQSHLLARFIVAHVLYNLIVLAGLVLLIVPGIIWGIKFRFYDYLIVDKGLGPIDALKQSSRLTKGIKWDLFVFGVLTFLVELAGLLALVLGFFVALPVVMVAYAYVYRRLLTRLELQTVSNSVGT